jgi:uncharacterized protein YukE
LAKEVFKLGKVDSSPEAIRTFAKQIQKFIEQENQVLMELKRAHSNIGSEWRDEQYRKFGQELDSMTRQIKNMLPAFESYKKHLMKKAGLLDDYLR